VLLVPLRTASGQVHEQALALGTLPPRAPAASCPGGCRPAG